MATTIDEPNDGELLWLAQLLGELNPVGVSLTDDSVSQYFDRQRAAWFAVAAEERDDPNAIINRVGAAVGELLVRSAGLRWVVASDEYGTELAVHGQPGDILIYPMNGVAKRWTGESGGTVADYIHGARSSIERMRGA